MSKIRQDVSQQDWQVVFRMQLPHLKVDKNQPDSPLERLCVIQVQNEPRIPILSGGLALRISIDFTTR